MKINRIELNNFGSYEGKTVFETDGQNGRNIILVGGKNGAGKTTLFTAMRLCLYGYKSMGYKSMNTYYIKAIKRLINNSAKLVKPSTSNVTMEIAISNGQELDKYKLSRTWVLTNNLLEEFTVEKNGSFLVEEDIANFEKFLLHIIPPELFNLYFFDGEKIADFFLEEGSSTRIKNAFLTLCGYDNFEIMSKNFKRVHSSGGNKHNGLNDYIEAKNKFELEEKRLRDLLDDIDRLRMSVSDCEAEIETLDKNYSQKGGITEQEWNDRLSVIKEEEKKREELNSWIKKQANDMIPFLVLKDEVEAIQNQLDHENNSQQTKNFIETLESEKVKEILGRYLTNGIDNVDNLIRDIKVVSEYDSHLAGILNLSFDDSIVVLNQIKDVLAFKEDDIKAAKKKIKNSIRKCAQIRAELDTCNLDSVNVYMGLRSQLLENKGNLLVELLDVQEKYRNQEIVAREAEELFKKMQKVFEAELKKTSIKDISAKAILMLDKLQADLMDSQIRKIETTFMNKMELLMRKKNFIDEIYIDHNFKISLYKNRQYTSDEMIKLFKQFDIEELKSVLGTKAIDRAFELVGTDKLDVVANYYLSHKEVCSLPIEMDKETFSNGEKQIFIMALYFSLIELCNNEVPFIIDTPFARIDTQHRENIARDFFCKLKGQVFILSTDEEINSSHIKIMSEKIHATYLLENSDNKRTMVKKDAYFEVKS